MKGTASQNTMGSLRIVTYNDSAKPEQFYPFIDQGPTFGGDASRGYRIRSLPYNVLVNREGIVIAEKVSMEAIESKIRAALKL